MISHDKNHLGRRVRIACTPERCPLGGRAGVIVRVGSIPGLYFVKIDHHHKDSVPFFNDKLEFEKEAE